MDYAELSRGLRRALTPAPGWPTRGALVRDVLLWLGMCLLILAEFHVWSVQGRDTMLLTLMAVALAAAVVALSRAYPLLAPCMALIVSFWVSSFQILLICVAYLAGRRSPRGMPAVVLFAVVAAAAVGASLHVMEETPGILIATGATLLFSLALPWLVGVFRRQHVELGSAGWEHARQLQLEQRLTADQARLRERSRIAQDMHDSLGHELSLIALRAGALEVSPDLGERHRQEVAELRATAVSATAHLREIIGVLRTDAESEPAPTAPAGESVSALVERARDSGMQVMLVRAGPLDGLPPMVDRAAYRVVQESMTNVAKYAAGAPVTVWLTADDARLEVRVTNAASRTDAVPPVTGGRRGLIGLRERVRLTGGTFAAGPHHDGWEVCASMPLDGDAVADPGEEDGAGAIDELQRAAHRRVQPWTLALVAAPVVLAVIVVGAVYHLLSLIVAESTLTPQDYEAISVGDSRAALSGILPPGELALGWEELEGFEPADESCDHYRSSAEVFDRDVVFYQLCYENGVLSAKDQLEPR